MALHMIERRSYGAVDQRLASAQAQVKVFVGVANTTAEDVEGAEDAEGAEVVE